MKHLLLLLCVLVIFCTNACAPKQQPIPQGPQVIEPPKQQELEKIQPETPKPEITPPKPKPQPKPKPKPKPKPEPKPEPKPHKKENHKSPTTHELIIIGETEFIYIEALKTRLQARIDTGAATSSLSASSIQAFERDGHKWVRFTIALPDGKESTPIERPLRRVVSVKRHGTENQRRPVVELKVSMGTMHTKTEFTLTDRSNFDYPVLIGRTFLRGNIAVDVSQKNLTSPMSE